MRTLSLSVSVASSASVAAEPCESILANGLASAPVSVRMRIAFRLFDLRIENNSLDLQTKRAFGRFVLSNKKVTVMLKRLWMLPIFLSAAVACSDDEGGDTPPLTAEQHLTCEISAPAEGATIDLSEKMTIRGDAKADAGNLSKVTLTVGGKTVGAVTSVPFVYDYEFAADQAAGALKIVLSVEGDAGAKASDEVNVTLKAPEQHLTCAISEPAAGAVFELGSKITIKGDASADIGRVASAALKIGGAAVADVVSAPFTYEYAVGADHAEGALKIELTVNGDKGGKASSEVTVTLRKPAPQPAENELIDPRDNHVYRTVKIGGQTWMAENLAYLPSVNKPSAAPDANGKPLCFVFNYDGEDAAAAKATQEYRKYGVLYNWYGAMNQENAQGGNAEAVPSGVQGICPDGWHLPSMAEWKVLEDYVASQLPPVKGEGWYNDLDGVWVFEENLKNVWSALAGLEGWTESNALQENPDLKNGPRDTFGFSGAPSGQCWQTGTFGDLSGSAVTFWTTNLMTQGAGTVDLSNLKYNLSYSRYGIDPRRGYPVRCMKD